MNIRCKINCFIIKEFRLWKNFTQYFMKWAVTFCDYLHLLGIQIFPPIFYFRDGTSLNEGNLLVSLSALVLCLFLCQSLSLVWLLSKISAWMSCEGTDSDKKIIDWHKGSLSCFENQIWASWDIWFTVYKMIKGPKCEK